MKDFPGLFVGEFFVNSDVYTDKIKRKGRSICGRGNFLEQN